MITPDEVMAIEVFITSQHPRTRNRKQQFKIETDAGPHGILNQHQDGGWFFNMPGGSVIGVTEKKLAALIRICAVCKTIAFPEYNGDYEI